MGINTGLAGVRHHADAGQILIAVAGLLAGIGVAWIVSRAGGDRFNGSHLPFAVPVILLVGWSFIGGGLLYWRSRPDNHLWAVLIFQVTRNDAVVVGCSTSSARWHRDRADRDRAAGRALAAGQPRTAARGDACGGGRRP